MVVIIIMAEFIQSVTGLLYKVLLFMPVMSHASGVYITICLYCSVISVYLGFEYMSPSSARCQLW